ncbi:MAG: efflux RND transporter periplasmic adaptor subunit [Roseomonas sp.]|nr:efflux RND transporter periplasmic adaptor subunit [Roseomonas sp.]MCA3333380.1 efflux RND transporter periplasmic adaptor subunit [Roseomonas sp.]MCA3346622.1 efflux RND transporter periplasmic adaptor subunit [Roseomonas sp.]MCA3373602.1 efflux RND transporter periplasmic adaptor subunit [Roseomonas sp.]MCA3397289.1 efflux RND transporter periplasmic adaptor subunit [Roseomonas sp.]
MALRDQKGAARLALPVILTLALPIPILMLPGCKEEATPARQQAAAPPAAVFVSRVERQAISRGADFIGRVEAIDRVDIVARVTGFLQARHFAEGDAVKAGQLLFTLEQPPFAAEVALRRAQLDSARADLANATTQVTRGRELVKTNAIPQATLDDRITAEAESKAKVAAAEAQLQQAQINYDYTEIRAPFDGRAGRSPLSPGNVVSPSSGTLVTIVRDDPIRISFPVTQRQLLQFRREGGAGASDRIKVSVRLPDGSMLDSTGRFDFIDVTTNRATDSVLVQAMIPNPQKYLVDGQAVTVVVEAGDPEQAIVIPQSALQIDQAGSFVLVVGAENKVEVKRVKTTRGLGGQLVVTEGLEIGQLVITEGAQRARPGAAVTPQPAPTTPSGAMPGSAPRRG